MCFGFFCRNHFYFSALTYYTVKDRFEKYSFLRVKIGTGRTHQIRVHMASQGYPVVGDKLYGAPPQPADSPLATRFFLHAWRITFESPDGGKELTVESQLPPPLAAIIEASSGIGQGDRLSQMRTIRKYSDRQQGGQAATSSRSATIATEAPACPRRRFPFRLGAM